MIEKKALDFLRAALPVPALMETPESPPKKYVVVEKTGGGEENHVKSATLAIQSVAGSLYEAAQLNEEVKEAMARFSALPEISSVGLNADYNFTDTRTKKYRYQAVFEVVHY